ncbi:MAG: 2,6-dihydroxypyridine 3-monooxygenase, partial [Alphaproteobacteria bacterium MarineAlpha3_Bin7]
MVLNKKKKRAIIVGGSIGGLFAGNILYKNGWEVDILEKAKVNLASRGTGIARHTELEKILIDLGLPPDKSVGIAVKGRTAFNRKGEIIAEYPLKQKLGAWNKVFEPLYKTFPKNRYHNGHKFIGLEQKLKYTRVFTSTGKHFDADVIIGADGFSSAVRKYIAPGINPRYGGYVGWRGISEELKLSDNFRRNLFSHYAFL